MATKRSRRFVDDSFGCPMIASDFLLTLFASGADTVLWLAIAERAKKFTGRYFFDRRPRSTHKW